MGPWKLLSEAPDSDKDGTWFLGYNPTSPMAWAPYEFVSWDADMQCWIEEDVSEESDCTHYLPLPAPPNDDWKAIWVGGPYERD